MSYPINLRTLKNIFSLKLKKKNSAWAGKSIFLLKKSAFTTCFYSVIFGELRNNVALYTELVV